MQIPIFKSYRQSSNYVLLLAKEKVVGVPQIRDNTVLQDKTPPDMALFFVWSRAKYVSLDVLCYREIEVLPDLLR